MFAPSTLRRYLPGLLLTGGIAFFALAIEAGLRGFAPLPAAVAALLLGMILHGQSTRPALEPGVKASASVLLRIAVALLGLKLSLADVGALGLPVAGATIAAMAATFGVSLLLARALGVSTSLAVLMGAANAVCGASATIAVAAVLPLRARRQGEVVLTIVLANAVSTLAMLAYPLLARWLELPPVASGVLMGASIQDMAQVVGAVAGMPEAAGNAGITIKMLRVFLLVPVVWLVGAAFSRTDEGRSGDGVRAPTRVPGFALAFVVLCLLNTVLAGQPAMKPFYEPVRQALILVSNGALLMALAALGLGTSVRGIAGMGLRPVLLFVATGLAVFVFALGVAALVPV